MYNGQKKKTTCNVRDRDPESRRLYKIVLMRPLLRLAKLCDSPTNNIFFMVGCQR